jgi:hypothetical protein
VLVSVCRRDKLTFFDEMKQCGSSRKAFSMLFDKFLSMLSQKESRKYARLDFDLFIESLTNDKLRQILNKDIDLVLGFIAEIVRDGQERGEIRSDIDPIDYANYVAAITNGIKLHMLLVPSIKIPKMKEVVTKALLDNVWTETETVGEAVE